MGARWLLLAMLTAVAGLGVTHATGPVARDLARPLSVSTSEYVGSRSCRHCHADNYDSWHGTFHRSMTQEATEASVLGDFDGARLAYGGIEARMSRDGQGEFVIDFSRAGGAERWRAVVVRTVGSRRYQQYLARQDDLYFRLPIAWNVEEQRFMHMNGAFLTPDPEPADTHGAIARADYDRHVTRWNDNCIFCHNVGPQPGLDLERGHFDTSVAELGIACEACHGPASDHVARNHDPVRRFALHLRQQADPSIANPTRLPDARSTEVCGRCHGQRIARDIDSVHRDGDRFVPGEELRLYSRPLARDSTVNGEEGLFAARFWGDGTPRLTAYEYQGLLGSACATAGGMTCGSCHAMHAGDPRGQLRPDLPGDAACTACHTEYESPDARASHSHHAADGPGSSCLECHMPKIVYGLVGAHRSHRVRAPDPRMDADTAGPDACTLCHVGETRAWAAQHAQTFWGEREPAHEPAPEDAPDGHDHALPEVTRLLWQGDPVARALAAAALGRSDVDTMAATAAARAGLLFDVMAVDEYPAVRSIAWRSARRLLAADGHAPAITAFTATDPLHTRTRAIAEIIAALQSGTVTTPDAALSGQLRATQDSTQIFIGE